MGIVRTATADDLQAQVTALQEKVAALELKLESTIPTAAQPEPTFVPGATDEGTPPNTA